MPKLQDLTGQVFGELTVVSRADDYILPCGKHQVRWNCKCSCGKDFVTRALQLKNGDSQSCGHLQREIVSKIKSGVRQYNVYDLSKEYGIGYDNKGREFYFDLEDYDKIKDYYWIVTNGYAETRFKNGNKTERIQMHRLIMCINSCSWKQVVVDHIGGNNSRHDNRKSNLRIVTVSQNNMNRDLQSNNTSGVAGVNLDKGKKKWRARIKVNCKEINLGYFDNFEDAVKARKEAEKKYFGEYAYDYSQQIKSEVR